MFSRVPQSLVAGAVMFGLLAGASAATAGAPAGPPLPKAANGNQVQLVAHGLQTTTSFAFGAGQVFAAEVPSDKTGGGVFVIKNGKATQLPGPPVAFGLAWRQNSLYVSAGDRLLQMRGWNGSQFDSVKVIYKAPKKFPGFNGIAFGANGRLYAGVGLAPTNDHGPASAPYSYSVLSFNASGKDLRVVATGIRQPWQLAFPAGSSSPYVSDLGQDTPNGIKAPDYLVRVRPGQAYGFPRCNWIKVVFCKGFAKPIQFFAPHTDIGGLAIAGNRLYISEFGFAAPAHPAQVVSEPLGGTHSKTVLSGFGPPIVGLGIHAGSIYVGDVAGNVFRTQL